MRRSSKCLQDFAMNFRRLKLLSCLNISIASDSLCVKLFCTKFIKTKINIKETTSALSVLLRTLSVETLAGKN